MKTIIIIAIIIVSTLSAVFIFSAIPSDIWTDQRTDFTGVSPPGELDEKIDCLSKGGVWDYTSCNFEEPEPEHISEDEMNLSDAMQKLQEIYSLNSSFGPFNIRDAIVGFGIAGDVLVVDVLTEYYESDHLDLIKQKIRDIVGDKVTIEFSPSGAIIPTNIESEPESQSTIQFKAKQLGIDNIMEATDSEELSYDEKREFIKYNYERDGPVFTPSLNLRIKDLTRNLVYGQQPKFTLIETGYANPCTAPKLEVYFIKEKIGYDLENDDLIFEHRIVMKCPYFDKFYPVLNYWSEKDFPSFPACNNEGRYLIVGDSGTERVALDEYYCNPK